MTSSWLRHWCKRCFLAALAAWAVAGWAPRQARADLLVANFVLGDYGTGARASKELQQAFSLNGKASDDTVLRKLTSVMRNNVNTNYGARERVKDTSLAPYAPDLVPSIAGQTLNSWTPRGLARQGIVGSVIAGGATMNPLALASLPLQSPRLVGEVVLLQVRGEMERDRLRA